MLGHPSQCEEIPMLEFTCSSCGNRVQGEGSSAGKHVVCPNCHTAITAPQTLQPEVSPALAIAAPEHAPQAKVTPLGTQDSALCDGLSPQPQPLPPIYKDVPRILMRYIPVLIVIGVLGGMAAWLTIGTYRTH